MQRHLRCSQGRPDPFLYFLYFLYLIHFLYFLYLGPVFAGHGLYHALKSRGTAIRIIT